jgi:hypothetical protein
MIQITFRRSVSVEVIIVRIGVFSSGTMRPGVQAFLVRLSSGELGHCPEVPIDPSVEAHAQAFPVSP